MSSWRSSSTGADRRVGLLLLALVLLSGVLELLLGPVRISPLQALEALLGRERESTAARIILYARLPRCLGSLLAGASLGASGAVIQRVLDNPLAAPNVIGVNAGAGFAAAVCCALLPGLPGLLPLAAFSGALAGVLLVLLLGEGLGASRTTVLLSGVAASAVFSGGVDLVLALVPEALSAYSDFRVGGFSGVTLRRVLPACAVALPALLLVLCLSPQMDLLSLGSETARSLGLRVRWARGLLLTAAAALAGAAVSVAGLLGFVGLMAPHMVRRSAGGESFFLVLYAALGGAAFTALCDLMARCLFAPWELPAGVLLSFLGGPFFLWLLYRRRRGGGEGA